MVVGYAALVPAMLNHEKDRHVAAAAVKASAQVIVTSNLRDFVALPDGIEAQAPDEFLINPLPSRSRRDLSRSASSRPGLDPPP
jgi:hypothetical protein